MKKLIILAASFVLVASFAMTAAAADWNFYGSARISTFWTNTDANMAAVDDVDDFNLGLQGNSRIGAKVKVSDELTGRFEYGTGVNVRLLYGEWNFGAGSLLVGQTYTPINMFYSGKVFGADNGLLNQGGVYSGRHPMLRLKFGNFQIAAVSRTEADGAPTTQGNEAIMPAIEASYSLSFDPVNIKVAGGYQLYEVTVGVTDEDVSSWVVALGASVNAGMFYVKGDVWIGENPGNLIAIDTANAGFASGGLAAWNAATTDIVDNDGWGGIIVLGAKINDMFKVEVGYGRVETELDISGSIEDEASSYYINVPITLAPGVFVIPEFGIIDYDESVAGVDETEISYFGAKWQINF